MSAAVPVSARRVKSTLQRRCRCLVRQTEAGEAKEHVSTTSGMAPGSPAAQRSLAEHSAAKATRLNVRRGRREVKNWRRDSRCLPGKEVSKRQERVGNGVDGTISPAVQSDKACALHPGSGGGRGVWRTEIAPKGGAEGRGGDWGPTEISGKIKLTFLF